jgi:hypothetical protein
MTKPKIYNVPGFQFAYIRSPKDRYGTMGPSFSPHWWVQYMGDGQSAIFDTKPECLAWIKSWDDIGENV